MSAVPSPSSRPSSSTLSPSSVAAEETTPSSQPNAQVSARPRNPSIDNSVMRSRKREIIALDGFMFDSSVLNDPDGQDDASDSSTNSNNITPDTASTLSDRQEPNRTLSNGGRSGSSLSSDQQESSLRALHRNNAAEALSGNSRPTVSASASVVGAPTPLTISSLHNNSDSNSNDSSITNGSQAQPLTSPLPRTVSYSVVVVEDSQDDSESGGQRGAAEELRHKTLSTSSVSSSSSTEESSNASSPTDSQTSPILEDDTASSAQHPHRHHTEHAAITPSLSVTSPTSPKDASAAAASASPSTSNRQSIFVGDAPFGLDLATDLTATSSLSSNLDNAGVDQEDMKEVQIETENPSHLFWVPFHLHPEIAPNEYNKWLVKHGVPADGPDGLLSITHRGSVRRRKSVLSSQYNPEDDHDEPATERRRPEANIRERMSLDGVKEEQQQQREQALGENTTLLGAMGEDKHDFLSGVFKSPLAQMGEPPLKKMTSLRRSVSLSVQSPTRDDFPANVVDEDLAQVKRVGLGGQSLLRRSARTKIRRNSTASNDTRVDASRLRPVLTEGSEYQAVSLVDPGFTPLPSATRDGDELTDPASATGQEREAKPLRRFVSTLRDPSKPTITTYVEPHLLEQQRKEEAEEASKGGTAVETNSTQGTSSYRANAPGQLESPVSASIQPTPEPTTTALPSSRKEVPISQGRKIDPVSYPIPPPVKLPQNLLQKSPSTGQPSPQTSKATKPGKHQGSAPTGPSHAKKPSTWSWWWGKEKEKEKANDRTNHQQHQSADMQQHTVVSSRSMHSTASTEDTHATTPVDSTVRSTASSSFAGAASSTATTVVASTTTTASASSTNTGTPTSTKKQSTFSMLFSRGTKSSNQQAQSSSSATTESQNNSNSSAQSVHGGVTSSSASSSPFAKPKYTNYNRLPIHIERAIYRLSHVKLANPRRPLHEQVLISNMMFWYLGVIQQQQMLQQQQQQELQQQQQMQQVAAEQLRASGQGETKSGKDGKKPKTKKRKSQKKKNGQQRGGGGGSSKAEVLFKSPQYDVQQQEIISQQYSSQAAYHQQQLQLQQQQQQQLQQQQHQQQQPHTQKGTHQYYNQQSAQQQTQQQVVNGNTSKVPDEYDQSARGDVETMHYDEESLVGGGGDYSDSIEEPAENQTVPGATGNMMSGRSVNPYGGMATTTILGHDNDDDVPLAHYQHVQRQGVPVS